MPFFILYRVNMPSNSKRNRKGWRISPAATIAALLFLLTVRQGYGRVEIAPCKNSYSPEQQMQLGQKVVRQVYTQMPVLPDSSPVTRYVQQLGQTLTAKSARLQMALQLPCCQCLRDQRFRAAGRSDLCQSRHNSSGGYGGPTGGRDGA